MALTWLTILHAVAAVFTIIELGLTAYGEFTPTTFYKQPRVFIKIVFSRQRIFRMVVQLLARSRQLYGLQLGVDVVGSRLCRHHTHLHDEHLPQAGRTCP